MDTKDILTVIDKFNQTALAEFKFRDGNTELHLKRHADVTYAAPAAHLPPPPAAAPAPAAAGAPAAPAGSWPDAGAAARLGGIPAALWLYWQYVGGSVQAVGASALTAEYWPLVGSSCFTTPCVPGKSAQRGSTPMVTVARMPGDWPRKSRRP